MRERSPGRWELRVYTGRDEVTKAPRQVSRTFVGGKRAAKRALDELVAEVSDGRHVGTAASFGTLLDAWSATLENTRSPNTADTYRNHIRVRIRPALGSIKLRSLTAHDLDAFYGRLLEEGLAVGTVQLNHAVISGALSQAVRWGWLRESPARFATPPREIKLERLTLSVEAVRALVKQAVEEDADLGVLVFLAALTGCRRGELVGFRWADVNWADQTIRVARSLVPAPGGGHREGLPKGKKARTLSLGPAGVEILAGYRALLTERLGHEPTEWLLTYDGEKPLRAKMVSDYVSSLGDRVGVPLHLHELRHWSLSTLVREGADVKTVQGRAGHAGLEETSGYLHTVAGADHEAAALLGRVLMPGTPLTS